ISEDDRPRHEAIGEVSRTIKQLSRQLRVPFVCAVQINREGAREGKEPELSQLRDSGALEQDADVVMLLHLPNVKQEEKPIVLANLRVAKQRNGPIGIVPLTFD